MVVLQGFFEIFLLNYVEIKINIKKSKIYIFWKKKKFSQISSFLLTHLYFFCGKMDVLLETWSFELKLKVIKINIHKNFIDLN